MSATTKRRRRARTCGELGGRTLAGKACTHPAGWQTSHPGRGRCREHDEIQEATRQALKKALVEALQEGRVSLRKACVGIGVQRKQLWRWRQADPAFDAAVTQAQRAKQERRLRDRVNAALVRESFVRRLISGNHSAAEIIFYLKNRDPERWNDRRIQRLEGSVTLEQALRTVAAEHDSRDLEGTGS